MSGLAYFFKPKITGADSTSSAASSSSADKRPGRRSKASKSSETPATVEKDDEPMETNDPPAEPPTVAEPQSDNPPTPTPKIKLKFNFRSQSVHDASEDRIITTVTNETNEPSDDESSDNDGRLKIDDNHDNFEEQDSPLPMLPGEIAIPAPSPAKKKAQTSRKKVISHLIGTTANTLSFDEPSPIKLPQNDSQFSEVKQTKSGRTIKYTPYFKELVQGATISPPSSPVHSTAPAKRPSSYAKKKQTPIKADLDAIKNGSLPTAVNAKGKKAASSPKAKKQTSSPAKRPSQVRKSTTPKSASAGKRHLGPYISERISFDLAKSKRPSTQPVMDDDMESDDDNDQSQHRSDDEEFRKYSFTLTLIFESSNSLALSLSLLSRRSRGTIL